MRATVAPPAVAAAPVRVAPVTSATDLESFLRLPWRIYRGDPNWVPPLLRQQRELLDRRRHPFHAHAEVEYFLARRGAQVVGRVAAIVNEEHDRAHGERAGFFGFFETVDDEEVSAALLGAAARWLDERGARVLRGPASFSSNEEWGLLVEGFDGPPVIMMAYNPPYYARLLERCGLAKAMDLIAYWAHRTVGTGERLERLAAIGGRARQRLGLSIRPAQLRHFDAELDVLRELYNRAWQLNWGFVPLTEAEIEHTARELRPIVVPELALFAFAGGRPVGAIVGVPDLNVALRHIDGRLFPFGLPRLLWETKVRGIKRLRLMLLGVVPELRRSGVVAALVEEFARNALRLGYEEAEFGWVLETNALLHDMVVSFGLRPYRRYRVYEASLDAWRSRPAS